MRRRSLLQQAALIPLLGLTARGTAVADNGVLRRVRPSDSAWPTPENWEQLNKDTGGQLLRIELPLARCHADGPACQDVLNSLKNPYYLGDQVALTGTTGWVDAWTSTPSVYAVAAKQTRDVVAAVNFARQNNLRLIVKGGGHSYMGTSDAPDSLLIWTKSMNGIVMHSAFVPDGCAAQPDTAVTIGPGAIWLPVYEAVMAKGGRYVQGGGCATVGVAGLVQSGGFGNFSKNYGTAAGSLLEAEIVTADGIARVVNACRDPELFWALKGGGGGSFGVVTRVTLKTHDMPDVVGVVFMTIKANSDVAYRTLIARFVSFYKDSLFNPHWGEQVHFRPDNTLAIGMLFQRLESAQARSVWQPFLDWVDGSPENFRITSPVGIMSLPARNYWDGDFLRTHLARFFAADDRPGAPSGNVWSISEGHEASQFMHGYVSAWLPRSLLDGPEQSRLADALFAGSRHWTVSLHFNKGLAGAPADAVADAMNTATNPQVVDAFALCISAASTALTIPNVRGHEPDLALARQQAASVDRAMDEILKVAPGAGSYVSEANYFQAEWQRSHWGANYPRLAAAKKKYDPDGLFIVHHGVGSEDWSADGFTRLG